MSSLIFIDTNIYLDFYRGGDATLSILNRFDANHDRIITTSEVEMEYKNNRQRVISKHLRENFKPPNLGSLQVPAFLKESKRDKALASSEKSLTKQINLSTDRIAKLLESPNRNDPVYKVLQRLFRAKGPCHLTRSDKEKYKIRRKARQRFLLGYPPRKPDEVSIVDALNWEWIIHCAQNCSDDIIIVSRDSDYGSHYQGKSILNDWLRQEFKERVSQKRSIILTSRLTEAFKQVAIPVSKEEEDAEDSLIKAEDVRKAMSMLSLSDIANVDVTNLTPSDASNLRKVISQIISESFSDFNSKLSRIANPALPTKNPEASKD